MYISKNDTWNFQNFTCFFTVLGNLTFIFSGSHEKLSLVSSDIGMNLTGFMSSKVEEITGMRKGRVHDVTHCYNLEKKFLQI